MGGKNKPPYELPANKTRSTFKTDSSVGDGFNELRFEDKAGEEEIFVHAQKDKHEITRRNHVETIGASKSTLTSDNLLFETGNDRSELVHGNYSITVGGSFPHVLGDNLSQDVVSNYSAALTSMPQLSFGSGNLFISASNSIVTTATTTSTETAGVLKAISAGSQLNLSSGANIRLVSPSQIRITCGAAEILLNGNGDIDVKGRHISMKGETMNMDFKKSISLKSQKIDMN